MTEARQPYNVGDRLRVIVNEPYSTELSMGDIVCVEQVVQDVSGAIVYIVATSYGLRHLYADVVTPFEDDYAPAEPDEIIDARLNAILSADPELSSWSKLAEASLGADEAELSPQLGGGTAVAEAEKMPGWTRPSDEDHFHVTDQDGEEMDVYYAEQQCPEHGREGVFFIQLNDEDVVAVPAAFMPKLILWLHNRTMHSRRPEA